MAKTGQRIGPRIDKRTTLCLAIIFAWFACFGPSVESAHAELAISFPDARYPHLPAGMEWWHYTGILNDDTGGQYGYFFTMLKQHGGLHAVFRLLDMNTGSATRTNSIL